MTHRSHIVVLQVPPFDPQRTLGGAEVITAHLIRGLAVDHEITVLCGHPQGGWPSERTGGVGVRVLNAFPIDEHVRNQGHIRPSFTGRARRALDHANLIVTVERSLADPPGVPRVVTLGGVAYPHTLDVLRYRAWDRLVVPSPFVGRQVAAHVTGATGVVVITNGIDTTLFRPVDTPRKPSLVRLLLPSRPVADKGLRSALALVTALQENGISATLLCVDQPDGLDGSGFLTNLRNSNGVTLEVLPWQPRAQMPAFYSAADLTLCLSEVSEGFGLTAAESIACGTPVLATPAGYLAEMLPPDHGIHWVDAATPPCGWVSIVRDALDCGTSRAVTHGRPSVAARYGSERMEREFAALVQSLLTSQKASPASDNA